jgi:drug/metabolite transporter (DMT)-like permease
MTNFTRKQELVAVLALLAVGASWGGGFVMMKEALHQVGVFDFLALRFTLATLAMIAVRPKTLRGLRGRDWVTGLVIGSLLGAGYIAQTIGLKLTTAAITGFLTGLYVVFTPLLARMIYRQKITLKVGIGAALATVGLGLISIKGASFEPNHLWLLACAILFALHIVALGRYSKGSNVYALTVLQLAAVSILCWFAAIPSGFELPSQPEVWGAIGFTVIFCTAAAFLIQTWAQSKMDSSRVAIVLTSEVVFAAIFAVAVGQETLLPRVLIGGLILVISMLVVEWPS